MSDSASRQAQENVVVVGLGYIGCVTAAALAELGHQVTGVDPDELKVKAVRSSSSPFYEPRLEPIIAAAVSSGRLRASQELGPALEDASVALVCVGTPSEPDGNLSLKQLRAVSEELKGLVANRKKRLVVAIRSTVFPGTCELLASIIGNPEQVAVVSNPEFLREGSAVKDFQEPSLLVVGGQQQWAVELVAGLYSGLPVEPSLVSLQTAELIKYACNSFHALKIGFANEIGTLAAQLGIDGNEVMATLCKDRELNISTAYLKPGFAFGGSCLPKDLRAISYRAKSLGLDLPLLQSVLPGNERHLDRAVQAVLALPEGHTGILGLAFKENTDDLRESPVIQLVQRVQEAGRELRIWDPHIQLDQIYGANLHHLRVKIVGIDDLMVSSASDLLKWSDQLVVTQKLSEPLASEVAAAGIPVLDLATRVPKL